MKFGIVEPAATRMSWAEAKEPWELYAQLGLPCDGGVDHGVVFPWHALPGRIGIAIVVDQFSLFVPPEEQRYFIIGRQLYGGNAVLYGYNEEGESIDLPLMPVVIFISVAGIEEAIAAGQIDRPSMRFNNDPPIWQWPQPSPLPLPQEFLSKGFWATNELVRPHIPIRIRCEVIAWQLHQHGQLIDVLAATSFPQDKDRLSFMLRRLFGDEKVHLDHDPPLCLREIIDAEKGIYDPPANDPEHLVYRTEEEHRLKTYVRGDGAQLSDAGKRRKEIKRSGKSYRDRDAGRRQVPGHCADGRSVRAPVGGPVRQWHLPRHEIEENIEFVAACLKLWDNGHDTKDISLLVFQPEYIVETTVRLGRERRRRMEG